MEAQRPGASTSEAITNTESVPAPPVKRLTRPSLARTRRLRPVDASPTSDLNEPYPKPSAQDWGALASCIGLVLIGFLILPSERETAIVGFAFFGPLTVLAAHNIIHKLRFRRMRAVKVEITGGVPIRLSRLTAFVFYATMAVMGLVLIAFGRSFGVVLWSCAWFFTATGAFNLLGLAVGWLPVAYVQFDPEGITIGRRRFAYTVPWDAIATMRATEIQRRPAVCIQLHDLNLLEARPANRKPQMLRHLAWNARKSFGAPVLLMTQDYGLDLPLLMKALERYVVDPPARNELSRRRLPPDDHGQA